MKQIALPRPLRALQGLVRGLFPMHQWQENEGDIKQRTCLTCGRCEQYEYDDWGNRWVMREAGDAALHAPAVREGNPS